MSFTSSHLSRQKSTLRIDFFWARLCQSSYFWKLSLKKHRLERRFCSRIKYPGNLFSVPEHLKSCFLCVWHRRSWTRREKRGNLFRGLFFLHKPRPRINLDGGFRRRVYGHREETVYKNFHLALGHSNFPFFKFRCDLCKVWDLFFVNSVVQFLAFEAAVAPALVPVFQKKKKVSGSKKQKNKTAKGCSGEAI